jgi:hypothetical protein
MNVSNFENPRDSDYVAWTFHGTRIAKQYASSAYATPLASHTGVIVVEPYDKDPNNAVIYNADGSERVRLLNPMAAQGAICFDYPLYVGTELTVISVMHGLQFACVFDEQGRLQRVYETR